MPVVHSGNDKSQVRISFEDAKPLLQDQLNAALEAEAAATALYEPWRVQFVEINSEIGELQRQVLALSHQAPRTVPAEEFFAAVDARDEARAALNAAKHRYRLLLRRAEPYSTLLGQARGSVRRARHRLENRPNYREVTSVPPSKFDELGIKMTEVETRDGVRRKVPARAY